MSNEVRCAIRGRVAIVVFVALGMAGLLAQQQATQPAAQGPLVVRWHLEAGQ